MRSFTFAIVNLKNNIEELNKIGTQNNAETFERFVRARLTEFYTENSRTCETCSE